ncbi:ring-cleaving dioxygenase [Paenibacillus sp. IB182496]|uniref:Ring-cleaving dioxygenase n=1 Tax=Paenibacillus sabuli TaxID=2772509 RepID=A0A927GR10_9BACL|nr:ring-cleaving dioxygenase [Paenibacillus sabuli]MBD2844831.1 ring-cleaving dioxygenase [Paenibacillus sabuli]
MSAINPATLKTTGIHHITAFARDPQANVDFYAGVLGLRLVKQTINFDAPEVYHLYFGDEVGSPGTILTLFPWPHARGGVVGGGQVAATVFAVPTGALGYWEKRLAEHGVSVTRGQRFGANNLNLADVDGLRLQLTEREANAVSVWTGGGVPAAYAIRGFDGAVLYSLDAPRTMETMETLLGMTRIGEDAGYARFAAPGELGGRVDVLLTSREPGRGGAGTVHHIAWRAVDDEQHAAWRRQVADQGYRPTPIVDRQYFQALYFREHGGILFEIATDPPGFARDEPVETLGEQLMLPEWFESQRAEIAAELPPIRLPYGRGEEQA